MKRWILPAAAAAMTLLGGAAMAQPYGYDGGYYDRPAYGYHGGYYDRPAYGHHHRGGYRDSDRDGVPDRVEWNRDRDHDGRPDQWDRYDNRRDRHHRYERRYYSAPYYDYGYRY